MELVKEVEAYTSLATRMHSIGNWMASKDEYPVTADGEIAVPFPFVASQPSQGDNIAK
jgi:hypothetical protein